LTVLKPSFKLTLLNKRKSNFEIKAAIRCGFFIDQKVVHLKKNTK
jgi:hypothetical protein